MSYQERFTCDVCGVEKKETNHWIQAASSPSGINFQAWNDEDATMKRVVHLCGESCAAIHLSEFLGKLKEGTV